MFSMAVFPRSSNKTNGKMKIGLLVTLGSFSENRLLTILAR